MQNNITIPQTIDTKFIGKSLDNPSNSFLNKDISKELSLGNSIFSKDNSIQNLNTNTNNSDSISLNTSNSIDFESIKDNKLNISNGLGNSILSNFKKNETGKEIDNKINKIREESNKKEGIDFYEASTPGSEVFSV